MVGMAAVAALVLPAAAASADPPPDGSGDFGYTSPWTFEYAQSQSGGDDADGAGVLARRDTAREVFGDTPDGYQAQYQTEVASQQQLYPITGSGPRWQPLGPTAELRVQNGVTTKGTDSGITSQVLQDPQQPDTVYVVADGGGLWKTTNFSAPKPTWTPLTDHLISTAGGHAAFGRDGTLYYGVGSPWYGNPTIGGVVYASHDGGSTWAPFANLRGASAVLSLAVDSSGPTDVVLAGTDFGLFRSTDQGATFSPVAGLPGTRAPKPGTRPERVYVWSLVHTSAGWLASAETGTSGLDPFLSSDLYLSTDQGSSWQTTTTPAIPGAGRTTLAVAQDGDSVVYALTAAAAAQDQAQGDLYRSTDGGHQWSELHVTQQTPTNPNADQPGMELLRRQAYYNQALLVDRTDASRNTVLVGGQLSSARTTDGGATWTLTSNWLGQFGLPYVHADFHGASQVTVGGRDAYVYGTDGGIAVSTDGAATWDTSKNQGLATALAYNVIGQPGDPTGVLLTLQDEGTRLRQGNTGIYNQVEGGDGIGVAWSQSGRGALTTVPYGKVAYSDKTPNKTKKWTQASLEPTTCLWSNGIDACDSFFYTGLTTPTATADPTGTVYFTYSAHHVYRTSDGGATFQSIYSGTGGSSSPLLKVTDGGRGVAVSPTDLDHVAAVSSSGRVVTTADGGQHWTVARVGSFVPRWSSGNQSPSYSNSQVLWVASVATVPGAMRVARSDDGGLTWHAAGTGLPDLPVTNLLADPREPAGRTAYAATPIGVYETLDAGASWHLFGSGLPVVQVTGLYLDPDGHTLLIATLGRGAWEITR